jgi:hypothetical protein
MIGFQSSILAGVVLVRSSIRSPNYVAGVSGWTINQDGSVEFNNAVIRGSVIAGNGAVRLDAGGVKVDGTLLQFDINFTGGHLARRLPDDGAYGQLTMASSTAGASSGGGVFMNPTDPTTVNGTTYSFAGAIYVDTDVSGGTDFGVTIIRSPIPTGQQQAQIRVRSQGSNSAADDSSIELDAAELIVTGIGHKEYVPYAGGITVTNSIVPFNITGTTLNLDAGGVYSVWLWASYNGPVAADARWSWAKTNAAVGAARHINALADSTADNTDSTMMAIRRGDATQQVTGTPNAVANAFSVYQEFTVWTNGSANDEAIQLQFAQGVANATGCLLQNGYIFLERIA